VNVNAVDPALPSRSEAGPEMLTSGVAAKSLSAMVPVALVMAPGP
jgi:hypothetical protein